MSPKSHRNGAETGRSAIACGPWPADTSARPRTRSDWTGARGGSRVAVRRPRSSPGRAVAGRAPLSAMPETGGPRPVVTVLAKPARRLTDRYLDTEDWRIARSGFVLRTRRRGSPRRGDPEGHPPGLRERTAPTPRGHRAASGRRGRATSAPTARWATGERRGRTTRPPPGARGAHPAPALLAAGGRRGGGRARPGRDDDRRRRDRASGPASPGRGRGLADRGWSAWSRWSPTSGPPAASSRRPCPSSRPVSWLSA